MPADSGPEGVEMGMGRAEREPLERSLLQNEHAGAALHRLVDERRSAKRQTSDDAVCRYRHGEVGDRPTMIDGPPRRARQRFVFGHEGIDVGRCRHGMSPLAMTVVAILDRKS